MCELNNTIRRCSQDAGIKMQRCKQIRLVRGNATWVSVDAAVAEMVSDGIAPTRGISDALGHLWEERNGDR